MLRLQASVFTSVNWGDLRVPRRIKSYKVWTSSPKGPGTGSSSADKTPTGPATASCLHPALRSGAGSPPPHTRLSLLLSPRARPSADAVARVLWSPGECLQPWLHQLSWKDKPSFLQPKVAPAQGHTGSQRQSLTGLAPGPQVGSLTLQVNGRS